MCNGPNLDLPDVRELQGSGSAVNLSGITTQLSDEGQALLEGEIVINGDLGPDSRAVSFRVRQPYHKGFCMSREEASEAYKGADWQEEYAAVPPPNVPVEEIKAIVNFPPSHHDLKPSPHAVVFLGRTEVVHRGETERVKQFFSYEDGVAKLSVPNPIIGLGYVISWTPPRKKGA